MENAAAETFSLFLLFGVSLFFFFFGVPPKPPLSLNSLICVEEKKSLKI